MSEFVEDIPPYAILSHTWEDDEISFSEFQQASHRSLDGRKGYIKIREFCEIARLRQLHWAWVDTCCINKMTSSEPELSEAINSMFRWYEDSQLCCVYLSDVSQSNDKDAIQGSRWFRRGWTLQELIAPIVGMEFYTQNWKLIGSRRSLCVDISSITNIPLETLYNNSTYPVSKYSVAQKMSWVSARRTTRPEDLAYCLLGLFNVNMPPLYGEGFHTAFRRLQLEMIAVSNDESIFAWSRETESWENSVLASDPGAFADDRGVTIGSPLVDARSYSTTNMGLKIKMHIFARGTIFDAREDAFTTVEDVLPTSFILAPINCSRGDQPLCLRLNVDRLFDPMFNRIECQVVPLNVQRRNSSLLKKVFLNMDPVPRLRHSVMGIGGVSSFPQLPRSLKVLQDELKQKVGHLLLSDRALDGRQLLYDEETSENSIKICDYAILDFETFLWIRNELVAIYRTSPNNFAGNDGPGYHHVPFQDFEIALSKFIRPREWAVSFLQRLSDACAMHRKGLFDSIFQTQREGKDPSLYAHLET